MTGLTVDCLQAAFLLYLHAQLLGALAAAQLQAQAGHGGHVRWATIPAEADPALPDDY